MSLTDPVMRQPTAAEGAVRVRHLVFQTVTTIQKSLLAIQKIVEQHGRSPIAKELGPDATQLQAVYDKLRSCLADIDPSRKAPDLPE